MAREYETLKRTLARRYATTSFASRQAYADAKGPFVVRVTGQALADGFPR